MRTMDWSAGGPVDSGLIRLNCRSEDVARMIDADTHVDETEATWERIAGQHKKHLPATVHTHSGIGGGGAAGRFWEVDGQQIPRAIRDDAHHPPLASRELSDVGLRLQDMDRLGVDIQVVFPTFFIRYGTSDPEAECDLATSYNRWVAEKCAASGGRLRWAAVLPWLDPARCVEELQWAKQNGACGIFKRGYELDRKTNDPHFFPIYEAASSLDLPICIHTGHPLPGREWDRGFPIITSFIDIVASRLPERFPQLRFGFIEAGASWIPYALSQLAMQYRSQALHERPQSFELQKDLFQRNRLFVSIDPVDDIEYLLTIATEDNLLIGTDYCHSDVSANTQALAEVTGWVEQGRITKGAAHKILESNPRLFYGL